MLNWKLLTNVRWCLLLLTKDHLLVLQVTSHYSSIANALLSFNSFHCHSLPHCCSLSYLSNLFFIIGVHSLLLTLVLFCFNLVFPPLLFASLNARSLNNLKFKPLSFINVSILGFPFC
jgi:hypothetical protein